MFAEKIIVNTDINFLTVIDGRKYVVMAKMKSEKEIEFYEVHFIRRNGYIARRKVWDITHSMSDGLAKRIEGEIYREANERT